ncbi:phosphoribosylamine--glycine ligase [Pseudidiomarina salinarum]|uniref:Phosphoribosylamine--glycine ligase n=1 Tax=Pseudidiomarina salinarum TaxID=435908 RepID=A0A094JD68_9GAMM|nr:phosphoribosylamine--glycine ligase [Pseudidiomarina salinarum]KFZ30516.1 phosphoribosylamine--glycine ligase [Pseudidiomarina salinarum]RUO69300.1 phosphoribosylamine--glycine ligase [Pseudidiomarina salinarum]
MNVLVIGGGGREHALAWKAAQSSLAETVYVAPGNAGTASEKGIENVNISAEDIDGLLHFAKTNKVGLTIVGPEAPLVAGIVDKFRADGLKVFGPTRAAAQLEGSKAFSKDFLARHNIPTAAYGTFTDIEQAKSYIRQNRLPIVIKADGLAAGKGVIIAESEADAFAAIDDMLAGNRFGEAGSRVVIEEFLVGEEASFIVMVDGITALPFASSQDHKARDDGDKGPNTGGMGAYSPAPVVTPEVHDWVMNHVIQPTIEGMADEGHPYTGFLYAGLMVAPDGTAKVLEFNCRFGDPETQPIMMRLQSDLVALCLAACKQDLAQQHIAFDERATVGVVLAAGGYPDNYLKGDVIQGIDAAEATGAKVFHAGTKTDERGNLVTAGGRVLCVTAIGDNVTEAQRAAYRAVKEIDWRDLYYRNDIAHRAIAREQ